MDFEKYQPKAFIYKHSSFEKHSITPTQKLGKPEELVQKMHEKAARLPKRAEKIARAPKKAPKEKEVFLTGKSEKDIKEKAIQKFVQENNLSAKFIKKNYNTLIFFSKTEGLCRVMFKKRELYK